MIVNANLINNVSRRGGVCSSCIWAQVTSQCQTEEEPLCHCHDFIQMCGTNVKGERRRSSKDILMDSCIVALCELVAQKSGIFLLVEVSGCTFINNKWP